MRRNRLLRVCTVCLLAGLLSVALWAPVFGQELPLLVVEPMMGSVELNAVEELSFEVTGAQNLNAFEVRVNYDQEALSVSSWDFGDLLSNLALVRLDDDPGSFRIVATQLATPGVSGDGVLLKIRFRGETLGTSPITIEKAEFARSDGGMSTPEVRGGTLTVIEPPLNPTATPTATASAVPTATQTRTPPPTATQIVIYVTATSLPTTTSLPTNTPLPGQTNQPGSASATAAALPTVLAEFTETANEIQVQMTAQANTAEPPPGEATASPGAADEAEARSSLVAVGDGRFLQQQGEARIEPAFWALLSAGILAIVAIVIVIIRRNSRL